MLQDLYRSSPQMQSRFLDWFDLDVSKWGTLLFQETPLIQYPLLPAMETQVWWG